MSFPENWSDIFSIEIHMIKSIWHQNEITIGDSIQMIIDSTSTEIERYSALLGVYTGTQMKAANWKIIEKTYLWKLWSNSFQKNFKMKQLKLFAFGAKMALLSIIWCNFRIFFRILTWLVAKKVKICIQGTSSQIVFPKNEKWSNLNYLHSNLLLPDPVS